MEYDIISLLYNNKLCNVYKIEYIDNKKIMAMKTIENNDTSGIKSSALIEISMLNLLAHQNIIKLYDFIINKKYISLILEYCENNLKEYISKIYPINNDILNDIFKQIVCGLLYCHNNLIIHRDLKPQNILIHNQSVKIADFGSACKVSTNIVLSHNIVTLRYRAPEILDNNPYSLPIDIWSLGCVLFEMIINEQAFKGNCVNTQKFLIKKENNNNNFKFLIKDNSYYVLIKKMLCIDPYTRITCREIYSTF